MVKLGNHGYKLMVSNSLDFNNNSLACRKSTKCLYLKPCPNSSFTLERSLWWCLLAWYSVFFSTSLSIYTLHSVWWGKIVLCRVYLVWYRVFGVWTSVFPILVSWREPMGFGGWNSENHQSGGKLSFILPFLFRERLHLCYIYFHRSYLYNYYN